jgi:hypothetical protein
MNENRTSARILRILHWRTLVVAACTALLVALVPSIAQATSWSNQSNVTVQLSAQVLWSKFTIDMAPGSVGSRDALWVKVNRVNRIDVVDGRSNIYDINSTNCIGVFGGLSNYKIEGDKNGLTCKKT